MRFTTIRSRFLTIIAGLLTVAMVPLVIVTKINFETELKHRHASQANVELQSLMRMLETEYDRLVTSELEIVANRSEGMENLMSVAMNMVGILHRRFAPAQVPEFQAREYVLEWIRTSRFGTEGFFFVCDFELKGLAHPMPEMEGRTWTGFRDVRLQDAFRHVRDVIKQEKMVHTVLEWPSPASRAVTRQTVCFRHFPEWGWIVGVATPMGTLREDADAACDKIILTLANVFREMNLTGKEHLILLDGDGETLFVSDSSSHIKAATAQAKTFLRTSGLLKQIDFSANFEITSKHLICSRYFKPLDWHILLLLDEDVALAPANRLLFKQIYFFLAVFAVGLTLALVLGRNLARPIEALARFARELPEQNFEVAKTGFPASPAYSEAEVVQLAEAFTFMADRLKSHLGKLNGHRDQLGELVELKTSELLQTNALLNDKITEHRRSEAELLEKTRLNQILLDAFPCIALLLRPRSREIVASNKAAVQVGAVPGKQCFATWGQSEKPCPWCLAPEAWATGEPRRLEVKGLGIWWDAHWIPINDDLYMHFAFDVTERRRWEEALQESEHALRYRTSQLETLQKIGLEVTAELNLETLLQSIVSKSLEFARGSSSGLLLAQPKSDTLKLAAAAGHPLIEKGERYPRDQGFVGEICKTGKPLLVDDYRTWVGHLPACKNRNVISVMGVPIFWRKSFLGVLVVRGDIPGQFSQTDADMLSLLATQAAVAIRNAEMFDRIERDAKTRDQLLREVNHRVGNNLTAISGLIALEQRHLTVAEQNTHTEVMEDLANRVNSLGKVHELLSASEWSPLNLDQIVHRIVHSSLRTLPAERRFQVEIIPSDVRVTAKQAHALALIVNELTTNAIKYALCDRNNGHITARIARIGDMLQLEFEDDGPGYPEDVLRMEQFNVGIDLIRQLTRRDLRGIFSLSNRPGASVIIRFPTQDVS